jgi:hypothetical protein
MRHRMTFAEAAVYVKEAQEYVSPDHGARLALWLLDQMSFDDEGVTLCIPDTAPQPFVTYH